MAQKRKKTVASPAKSNDGPQGERLQKVLAAAGVASRRHCEEYITSGRVTVDGEIVTKLGTRVDPQQQDIAVDGVRLRRPKLVYYAVNKPVGIVSTNSDPSGRPRVIDLVPSHGQRLFTVGRLDKSSEGLILVTNDGELAQRLTHPQYEIEKTYDVVVAGDLSPAEAREVERGVHLSDGLAQVAGLKIKNRGAKSTRLQMVLREGRNREIRRVLASVGHKVLQLRRVRIAGLSLGDLQPSEFRQLNSAEVSQLRRSVPRGATIAEAESEPRGQRKRATAKSAISPGYRPRPGKSGPGGARKKSSGGGGRKQAASEGARPTTASTGERKNKSHEGWSKKSSSAGDRSSTSAGGGRKKKTSYGRPKKASSPGGRSATSAGGERKNKSHEGWSKKSTSAGERSTTSTGGGRNKKVSKGRPKKAATGVGRPSTSTGEGRKKKSAGGRPKKNTSLGGRPAKGKGRKTSSTVGGRKGKPSGVGRKKTSSQQTKRGGKSKAKRR